MKGKIINVSRIVALSLVFSAAIGYSFAAWTPPTVAPPGGNPEPPINTSATAQIKTGNLGVNNLNTVGSVTTPSICLNGLPCINSWPTGADNQQLRLVGTTLSITGSGGAGTINSVTLPSGGGGVTGSGTLGKIPMWATGTSLGNSGLTQDTNFITFDRRLRVRSAYGGDSAADGMGLLALMNEDVGTWVFRVGGGGGLTSGPNIPSGPPPATYLLQAGGNHSKAFIVENIGIGDALVIENNGLVGINMSTPTSQLDITNSATAARALQIRSPSGVVGMFVGGGGAITSLPLAVAQNCVSHDAAGKLINCLSDSRLKKNIASISDSMDVIAALKQLRGVYFNWDTSVPAAKDMGEGKNIGLIAQEVEKVFPEAVATDGEGYKSLDKSALVGFLIEVNKKQQAEIEGQQSRIEKLEQDVALLKSKI